MNRFLPSALAGAAVACVLVAVPTVSTARPVPVQSSSHSLGVKPDFRLYGRVQYHGIYRSLCVAVKDSPGGSRRPEYFDLFHPSDKARFGHYELGVRVEQADPATWGKGWRRWWVADGGEYAIRPTARRLKVSESFGESRTTIPRIGARKFSRICELPT